MRADARQDDARALEGAVGSQLQRHARARDREVDRAPAPELDVRRAEAVRRRQPQGGDHLEGLLGEVVDAVVAVEGGDR